MPKQDIDYSKTIIYKIVCNDLNIIDVYIGATTDFTRRKGKHKSSCYNENIRSYGYKLYKFIRDNGGWDNFSMIEIEKFKCRDGNESRSRERYWIETLNASLNDIIPTRTYDEYYQDNRDKLLKKANTYRKNNLIKIKHYREENKEKIIAYRIEHKEDTKAYYKEYQKKRFDCSCGDNISFANKSHHIKTKKHQAFLNSQVIEV
jgi:hypothetical protein